MDMEFSMSFSDEEPVEDTFLKNIRFAEWWQRERARNRKLPLAERLRVLFDELPKEAVAAITDDQGALIAEMVRTRNALIHSDDSLGAHASVGERLKAITTKLGMMLWFHLGLVDFGEEPVREMAMRTGISHALYKYLSQSDRPDDRQQCLPGCD
jgi:hypothetical protein